jgi:hypothetical protein
MSPCYQLVAISDDKCTFGRVPGAPPTEHRALHARFSLGERGRGVEGRTERWARLDPVTREKERT